MSDPTGLEANVVAGVVDIEKEAVKPATDRWGRPLPTQLVDRYKRDIKPGDFVIVGHAAGRTSTLKVLKVVGIDIPQQKIKALASSRYTAGATKYTYLTYPERMMVVERYILPRDVVKALDDAELSEPVLVQNCHGCKTVPIRDEQAREVNDPVYFRFGDETRVLCGGCGQIVVGEVDSLFPTR